MPESNSKEAAIPKERGMNINAIKSGWSDLVDAVITLPSSAINSTSDTIVNGITLGSANKARNAIVSSYHGAWWHNTCKQKWFDTTEWAMPLKPIGWTMNLVKKALYGTLSYPGSALLPDIGHAIGQKLAPTSNEIRPRIAAVFEDYNKVNTKNVGSDAYKLAA